MTDDTQIDDLPTTNSGSVRKQDTLRWLEDLETPNEEELIAAVTPQPTNHSGSKYATEISSIRVTGTPAFVETVAALLQPLLAWESSATRLAVNLQETEDRDTGDMTGNYALYLSAAVRGKQGAMSRALLGEHREEDQKLANALDRHGDT
ncbi:MULTISPECIES: hypothetical protein [Haloferacaceae]|uniref:Uncharacterized protein n=1 Tax=Halorubrum glutamatedens TaxID=2707018 RepID=A0ABD5QN89_9EURY|nr:hypothetical protein [Halobellus captivus]